MMFGLWALLSFLLYSFSRRSTLLFISRFLFQLVWILSSLSFSSHYAIFSFEPFLVSMIFNLCRWSSRSLFYLLKLRKRFVMSSRLFHLLICILKAISNFESFIVEIVLVTISLGSECCLTSLSLTSKWIHELPWIDAQAWHWDFAR